MSPVLCSGAWRRFDQVVSATGVRKRRVDIFRTTVGLIECGQALITDICIVQNHEAATAMDCSWATSYEVKSDRLGVAGKDKSHSVGAGPPV